MVDESRKMWIIEGSTTVRLATALLVRRAKSLITEGKYSNT